MMQQQENLSYTSAALLQSSVLFLPRIALCTFSSGENQNLQSQTMIQMRPSVIRVRRYVECNDWFHRNLPPHLFQHRRHPARMISNSCPKQSVDMPTDPWIPCYR